MNHFLTRNKAVAGANDRSESANINGHTLSSPWFKSPHLFVIKYLSVRAKFRSEGVLSLKGWSDLLWLSMNRSASFDFTYVRTAEPVNVNETASVRI